MIDVEPSEGAKLIWPPSAGECWFRDSTNHSWWIGIDLWEGAPKYEYEVLSKLYPKGNIKIEIKGSEEYDIYDLSKTKRILAGEGESLTNKEVSDILSSTINAVVALDEDCVKEIRRTRAVTSGGKRPREDEKINDDDDKGRPPLKKAVTEEDMSELGKLPKGQSYCFDYTVSTNTNFEHAMMCAVDQGKYILPPHFAVFNIRYSGRDGLFDKWELDPVANVAKEPSLSSKNSRMALYDDELKLKNVASTSEFWNSILAISTRERVILNTKVISPKLFATDYPHLIDNENGDTKLSVHTATFFDPQVVSPKHFSPSALVLTSAEEMMRYILSQWTDCVYAKDGHFGHKGWKFVHNVYYP